jgi:Ser-tRNA(Ala) deacylase AlaX
MTVTTYPETQKLYFLDSDALTGTAKLLAVIPNPLAQQSKALAGFPLACVLDRTLFHAQGGGQPSDAGSLTVAGLAAPATFEVKDVRFDPATGIVYHLGAFPDSAPAAESIETPVDVTMDVNLERRVLNMRLHSAGHLIDAALAAEGFLGPHEGSFTQGKGHHFPDGPCTCSLRPVVFSFFIQAHSIAF